MKIPAYALRVACFFPACVLVALMGACSGSAGGACNPSLCEGCCKDGVCFPGSEDIACGQSGQQCNDCSLQRQKCASNSCGPVAGGAGDGGTPDAGPQVGYVEGFDVWGSASSPTSCDALCATKGYTCGACRTNPAEVGFASYQSVLTRDKPVLACADAVPASITDMGTSYTLSSYKCCCFDSAHRRVAGDPANPKACNDVCSVVGLACDPATMWSGGLNGSSTGAAGGAARYQTSGGLSGYYALDCVTAPSLTRGIGPSSSLAQLSGYDCGCR